MPGNVFPSYWKMNYNLSPPDYLQEEALKQSPDVTYAYITQPATTRVNRGYAAFLNRMQPTYYNRYLADTIAQGETATGSFYDWLNSNSFNPYTDYLALSPTERGESPGVFSGRGRWVL